MTILRKGAGKSGKFVLATASHLDDVVLKGKRLEALQSFPIARQERFLKDLLKANDGTSIKALLKTLDQAIKGVWEVGNRIRVNFMSTSFSKDPQHVGRKRLLRAGFTELPLAERGRRTFEKIAQVRSGGKRTFTFHYDPYAAGGGHWHKYVRDENGRYYELNDRGYVMAFGKNNPIGRVHISGSR